MDHHGGDHGGVLRIDGWDEHLYWEIDFIGMKATRWMELSDDDWAQEQFPIRRQDGAWEIQVHRAARWRRFDDEIASELEVLWGHLAAN